MNAKRHFATISVAENDVLTSRTIEVPFPTATLGDVTIWLQWTMSRTDALDDYHRLWEFHRECAAPRANLTLTFATIDDKRSVSAMELLIESSIADCTPKNTAREHGFGWLLHLQFFVPKMLLEPWYRELLEACDDMIDAGKSRSYIRAAVVSQLALLLLNRAKLLSLEAVERVVAGIAQIVR